ncbi:MAG: hypothetical protein FWH25_00735 [Syntrophorhabdaceae bacterium]|nr:hypothetical protein [Syntrophorhabdaceae bacterium]
MTTAEKDNVGAIRRIARWYLHAATFYLSLGAVLGVVMIWHGNDNYQFLHGHMLLVGALVFAFYGAGNLWISGRAEKMPLSGPPASLAVAQFWLANIGLPGMLLWSVAPVGLGPGWIGAVFGLMEAVAAVMYGLMARRVLKTIES